MQNENAIWNDIQNEFGSWVAEMTIFDEDKIIITPEYRLMIPLAIAVADCIRQEWKMDVVVEPHPID